MGFPNNVTYSVSVGSFMQCDGSNFTTAGLNTNMKIGNGSIGTYTGIGTEFKDNSTGVIVDLKGGVPYGNSDFSGGFRLRNNINPTSQTLQFRGMPINYSTKLPIGENTKLYANPYIQSKYHYDTGELDNPVIGGFIGTSIQVAEGLNIWGEGQLNDVTNISNKNTSINLGITYTF